MGFLPATNGVILKYSFEGAFGFRLATALPVPAFAPEQPAVPLASSRATEQDLSPLVLSFSVFGIVMSIRDAVVLLSSLLRIVSLTVSDLGFFAVPALVGETEAVTST